MNAWTVLGTIGLLIIAFIIGIAVAALRQNEGP